MPSTDADVLKVAECNEAGVGFDRTGIQNIWYVNFFLAMIICLILNIFIYVFIEKQGINARSAFKSKWQKGVSVPNNKVDEVDKKDYHMAPAETQMSVPA